MKKRIKIGIIVILIISVSLVIYGLSNENPVLKEKIESQKKTTLLSMMVEQTRGAGDYEPVTQSNWPTEGYLFNSELSRCENGGKLSWDKENNNVVLASDSSDKCYVYFDIYIPNISDYCSSGNALTTCVKNFGDQGSDISKIYIHNSSLTNGAGDNSYRFSGPDAEVLNFVCFGSNANPCPEDNLYRIIGLINNSVKLIKYDYASSDLLGTNGNFVKEDSNVSNHYKGTKTSTSTYVRGTSSNVWSTSALNTVNLNTNYLNNIGTTWANKIATSTWKFGNITWTTFALQPVKTAYNHELSAHTSSSSAKIGLMYGSEYGFAASPDAWTEWLVNYETVTDKNWMYMGDTEATMGSYLWGTSSNNPGVVDLWPDGHTSGDDISMNADIRPAFNLVTSVTYVSGMGTKKDPIRIN